MTELETFIEDNNKLIAEIDDWIAQSKPQYIDYEKCKNQSYEVQRKYNNLLAEKERLFSATQPQAIKFDKEVVSGGKPGNSFENYLMIKERKQIDERLAELKTQNGPESTAWQGVHQAMIRFVVKAEAYRTT